MTDWLQKLFRTLKFPPECYVTLIAIIQVITFSKFCAPNTIDLFAKYFTVIVAYKPIQAHKQHGFKCAFFAISEWFGEHLSIANDNSMVRFLSIIHL